MYKLTASEQAKARAYLDLRFRDASRYEDAISMAYLELDYVSLKELIGEDKNLLDSYNRDEYIPENVLLAFKSDDAVPVRVNIFSKEILVIYACKEEPIVEVDGFTVKFLKVPAFIFFTKYLRSY